MTFPRDHSLLVLEEEYIVFILLAIRDLRRLSSLSHQLSWLTLFCLSRSKTFYHSFSLSVPHPPHTMYVFMCVHMCEHSCPHRLEEGIISPRSGVTGNCEPLHVRAGDRLILCKTSRNFSLPARAASPAPHSSLSLVCFSF